MSESTSDFKKKYKSPLRVPRASSYFERSTSIRWLLGFFITILLVFFLYSRETYVETLKLGTLADRYIVAQVDFAFPDEEATLIFKQEAARNVGIIYRISEEQIRLKITEFQKFITQNEDEGKRWNELVGVNGLKNLAQGLNALSDGLMQCRFTDMKTVVRIEDLSKEALPFSKEFVFPFMPFGESEEASLPVQFWILFSRKIFDEHDLSRNLMTLVLRYFEKVCWKFEEDQGAQYSLRKLVQSQISEKYTRIAAGERIIDQGEKVTARHLVMLQAMKEKLNEERKRFEATSLASSALIALLFVVIATLYLRENHKDILYSNRKLALFGSIVVLTLMLAKITEFFVLKNTSNLIDIIRFPLFVPFAAILLSCLIDRRIAAFATVVLSILFTLVIPVVSLSFLVNNMVTATIAILAARRIKKRKDIFTICGKAWVASIVVIAAFHLYENLFFPLNIALDLWTTFFSLLITAVLVVGLLPLFESLFQIMTDMTLMEFLDPNNELLRRLAIEAPGTYQHSMVVGSLAENAAHAIGAHALFCRVASEYHDIGKLSNPQYFTENQFGNIDMHQLLTPKESTQVIIAHVSEGVALARKVGLPEPFIDIIKEHHGTTLVYYFYKKELEAKSGDKREVDEREFRYCGPKPTTKESTIIMIADSVEAASRTLDTLTEESLEALVEGLVARKIEDGQFDDSPLTCSELAIVKSAFVKNLLAAGHARIKYPSINREEEG